MDYELKDENAATYLKGQEVGEFIKKNYGEELLTYTNKDLLKELNKKGHSANYNTLRKEAGRIRQAFRFKNMCLETVLIEGTSIEEDEISELIEKYIKNPKAAESCFKKNGVKRARKSKIALAKNLGMTLGELENYVYSESKKVASFLSKEECDEYLGEFDKLIEKNNYVKANSLTIKMAERAKEYENALKENLEKIDDLIIQERLDGLQREVELEKDYNEELEKIMEFEEINEEEEEESTITYLTQMLKDFKTMYPNNRCEIIPVSPEKLLHISKYLRDKDIGEHGAKTVIYTDGKQAFSAFPDAHGVIRDTITLHNIEKNPEKAIELIKTLSPEIYKLSTMYNGNVILSAMNMHANPVSIGNPNIEYKNFSELVEILNKKQ
ncbi:MAG: hypothetical protein PHT91_00160 [Candidatus Nanoarchaeia archaeon]|nr:hypothetical protein [Candidatus Nanoarchaeia archaeon]MDD5054229.1 hypothetical protein [Candidatus Nanoarchaeia archaeon]MDD5499274.1 hypothetical protein [Candidatus Nanoarchaeia archaeon]